MLSNVLLMGFKNSETCY